LDVFSSIWLAPLLLFLYPWLIDLIF
jgi:hypothetical protein